MFCARKCLIIVVISILFFTVADAEPPAANTVIVGNGTRGPYLLGYENILSNSMTISRDGIPVDPQDFNSGNIEGVLWFTNVIPLGDTLLANFQYLPVSIRKQYYLREMKPRTRSGNEPKTRPGTSISSQETDIRVTGSKGFSIESGDGADRLSQSLNLNINGELVPGLKTSAHISDKSANGGSVTRRLNELDKIYIEAESRFFKGTFGDFDLIEDESDMMSFQRKLTGLNLRYRKGNNNLGAAAGFFPGEYRRITLAGIDGRLGPYYLTDINGREGILVLPGSDRVYLDGELLFRGSEKDYTIDYESGAILFTPSIIIRNETRINVEYEIAREEYSRSFYSAAGGFNTIGRLTVFSKLIQEGDNRNSPKSFEMTSENRGIIDSAGSDPLGASKNGVTFTGPGEGDYDLAQDSLGNQYYDYAGSNLGEYDITFSFVGDGSGSYRSLGGGVFQYAGQDSGDYESIILLPIPQSRRYGAIGSSWNSEDNNFNFRGEFSGSIHDRNTVSDIDPIQKGTSGTAEIDYTRSLFESDAFAGIGIKARKIGKGMIFPGRVDNIERYRDYDLEPGTSLEGERLAEVLIKGGLSQNRKLSLLLGDLRYPNARNRKRFQAEIDWRITGPVEIDGNLERTSGERIWLKRDAEIKVSLRNIQPVLGIEYERRDGSAGFKYNEYTGKLPATLFASLKSTTELSIRNEKALEGTWVDKFQSGYLKQNIIFSEGKSGISGELNGSYYKKKYKDLSGADSEQKSGWARLNFVDPRERFEMKINERLSAVDERIQSRNFILVGGGEGEYRLEDGEYIRDPDGDYILVLEELGEGEKITEISSEISGRLRPFTLFGNSDENEISLGRLIFETELKYDQKKSEGELTFEDFIPWKKDNLDDLVFRNGRLDMRLFYYPPLSKHRFKYNLVRSYQDGRKYFNEASREEFMSDELSWAFPAGDKINLVLKGLIAEQRRQINQVNLDLGRHRESATVEYKFYESWNLRFGAEYENIRQKDLDITSRIPSTNYGLIRELGKKGRVSAELSYFRVIVEPRDAYIPYQVAGGKRQGDNFEGIIRARLEPLKNGRFELSYRIEKFSQRPEKQNLRLEFTLLFL
jgi:hypothetical protein